MSHVETGTLATGLYDFEGVRADNLPFKKGEVITIIEMNDTGWWKGANADGRVGIFPYNYVEARTEEEFPDFRIVKAIAACDLTDPGSLNFRKGDLITVLKPIDDNWSLGKLLSTADNQKVEERVVGKFPLTFIEETGEVDETAEEEENQFHEEQERLKEEEARKAQEERRRIERETEIAAEKERKRIEREEQKKIELEQQKKLEAEKRKEMEQKLREESRQIRATARERALAEARRVKEMQEEKEREIEREKQKLEDEIAKMKREIERFAQEAEEAKKRAMKAEHNLTAAKAESQRVLIAKEKKQSVADRGAQQKMAQRAAAVNQKINQSISNFRRDDGFSTPPPLEDQARQKELQAEKANLVALRKSKDEKKTSAKAKKFVRPSRFSKLGKAGIKCKKCGKSVGFGPQVVKAIGASWHKECFVCSTCSKRLRGEWLEHGGFPYCPTCHKAGFGIKGFGFGGAVTGNYK